MNNLLKCTFSFVILCLFFHYPVMAGEERKRASTLSLEYSNVSDVKAEISFGRDLAARILGNYKLLDNEKINKYVNLVGRGIAIYSGRPEIKYYFGVLDTDDVNAFATPGGYIFITRGLLKKVENEAQLAGVLGHEIAHVVKKHVVNELNIKGEEGSAASGISSMIGGATGTFRVALDKALDEAENILLKRGYKIKDEIEADRVGILLAGVAGYDPMGLQAFLKKARSFEIEDKTHKGEHPVYETRMKKIKEVLVTNGLINVKLTKVRERYYEYVNKADI